MLEQEQKYYYYNKETFKGSLDLMHGFLKRDYSINMHVQEFVEINIITRGCGMHYIGHSKVPAQKGDVFIIPPHIRHGYVRGEGFDVYHVLLSHQFMEKYTADLQQLSAFYILFQAEPLLRASQGELLNLTLDSEQFEKVEQLLQEITEHTQNISTFDKIICNSLGVILITSLCRIYTENACVEGSREESYDEAFMNALAQIHQHYNEKITIEELAQIAQLSRTAFMRRFQEICHMPPGKYLNKVRLQAAESMLLNTSFTVGEISMKTGFYDPSHFIRVFTSEYGRSPVTFRKERVQSNG